MPTSRSVSQIKSALLHPATTSHFEIELSLPQKLTSGGYLNQNGIQINSVNFDKLNLLCSEASLPGSNLATLELTNDYTGVTERHAYRRVYDDRIDLTFYVDAENYLPIRVFETWIKYIAQEASDTPQQEKGNITSRDENYFYRFQYVDDYRANKLSVIKFEKSTLGAKGNLASTLQYDFIKTYPISVSSMPVSYESSSLLKCMVSMTYIRYILNKVQDPPQRQESGTQNITPIEQASFNSAPSYFLNPQFGVEGPQGTPRTGVNNDFLNIGNPTLDQFGVRDQLGRGSEGTLGANLLA